MTFTELAEHFKGVAERAALVPEVAAARTAPILIAEAKEIIATHVLRDLMQSTQDKRQAAGHNPNDPLLLTGEYRESITGGAEGPIAFTGTNDPRGKWFEYGTPIMQPFSNFQIALENTLPQALEIATEAAREALEG